MPRTNVKRTTNKRGRASKSTPLKKVVKSAVKSAGRGASDVVKAGGKVGKRIATSKRGRTVAKAVGHTLLGTTGLAAIGSATKRKESPADKRKKAAAKRKAQMRIKK